MFSQVICEFFLERSQKAETDSTPMELYPFHHLLDLERESQAYCKKIFVSSSATVISTSEG